MSVQNDKPGFFIESVGAKHGTGCQYCIWANSQSSVESSIRDGLLIMRCNHCGSSVCRPVKPATITNICNGCVSGCYLCLKTTEEKRLMQWCRSHKDFHASAECKALELGLKSMGLDLVEC